MKKGLLLPCLFGLVSFSPLHAHGRTNQDMQGAYQPANVVSVKKLETTADYAYDIGFQLDCRVYVARYKSANDQVPEPLTPKSNVNVRVDKHWLHVFLPLDREVAMRLVKENQTDEEACSGNTAVAPKEPIPAGTILPVSLKFAIRSDKSQVGTKIVATVMQDVPLEDGALLPKGSRVLGHIVEAVDLGQGSDEARISFEFDQVWLGNRSVPITTNLRALASEPAVLGATPQLTSPDYPDNQIQIGGDQISYGKGRSVTVGSQVVGTYTSQGVLAYVSQHPGTPCRGAIGGNTHPQAFWFFSVNACGVYGFGDMKVLHSGRTKPAGQVTLVSDGRTLNVGKGTGMLLRVDHSGPHEQHAEVIPSRLPAP
jgi:hypothetical protein